jgi:hypothetical protein
MILVAAAAAGFAIVRATVRNPFSFSMIMPYPNAQAVDMTPWMVRRFVDDALSITLPFLATFTWAFAAIRLRPPRPPLRRIARQPGAVACAAATLAMAWIALLIGTTKNLYFYGFLVQHLFLYFSPLAGFAVLGSWATLSLGRACRPESSWIDVSGRVLGATWIVATALIAFRHYGFEP